MRQGTELLRTGHLRVRVDDPEELFELGRLAASGELVELRARFDAEASALDEAVASSPLPVEPDVDRVDAVVREIRHLRLAA